jgi:hypothetical protein
VCVGYVCLFCHVNACRSGNVCTFNSVHNVCVSVSSFLFV